MALGLGLGLGTRPSRGRRSARRGWQSRIFTTDGAASQAAYGIVDLMTSYPN